jgi:hypothetical protein
LPPIPKLGKANPHTLTLEEGFSFFLEKVKGKKKRRGDLPLSPLPPPKKKK